MSAKRSKMTKEEEAALFQKATEALRSFGENPDAARGFFDALKKGNFSEARKSLNAYWNGGAKKTTQQPIAVEFLRTRGRRNCAR